MIKIAMVNTENVRGGAARMASTLTQSLVNDFEDFNVTLYHCGDARRVPPCLGLRKPFSRQLNTGLARMGGSFFVFDMGVAQQIINKSQKADVLHIHNLHGYYLNFNLLLKAWRNRPVIWTWHDMWGATGRCGYSLNCQKWKQGCGTCPTKKAYPKAWFDRSGFEHQRKTKLFFDLRHLSIVSPSQWLAEIAIARGFAKEQVHVLPNPVETGRFKSISQKEARTKLNLPLEVFITLFIASDCNDPRKGYRDFTYAVDRNNCLGIAVGKKPKSPTKNILHTGQLSKQDLINLYYAAADVMLIPTYADNYPNTVIESLVCGTPVVGYNEGGLSSQLNMPYCQVVQKGEKEALSSHLQQKIDNGTKTSYMEQVISAQARKRWNQKRVTLRYSILYKEMLEKVK